MAVVRRVVGAVRQASDAVRTAARTASQAAAMRRKAQWASGQLGSELRIPKGFRGAGQFFKGGALVPLTEEARRSAPQVLRRLEAARRAKLAGAGAVGQMAGAPPSPRTITRGAAGAARVTPGVGAGGPAAVAGPARQAGRGAAQAAEAAAPAPTPEGAQGHVLRGRALSGLAQTQRKFKLDYKPWGRGAKGQKAAEHWVRETSTAQAHGRSESHQKHIDEFLTPDGNDHVQQALTEGWDLSKKEHVEHVLDPTTGETSTIKHAIPSEQIHALDASMKPLGKDVYLTRTVGPDKFGVEPGNPDALAAEMPHWKGRMVYDPGYTFASVGDRPTTAELADHGITGPRVHISIMTPQGTKALVPGKYGDGKHAATDVVLPRDQYLRIYDVTQDPNEPGVWHVWATISSPSELEQAQPHTPAMTELQHHAVTGRAVRETPRALGTSLSGREKHEGAQLRARRAAQAPPVPAQTEPGKKRVVKAGTGKVVTRPHAPLTPEEQQAERGIIRTRAEARAARAETERAGRAEHTARTEAAKAKETEAKTAAAQARAERLAKLREERAAKAKEQEAGRAKQEIAARAEQAHPTSEADRKEAYRRSLTKGGTDARYMTPAEKRSVLTRAARSRARAEAAGREWPSQEAAPGPGPEEQRLADLERQIKAMPEGPNTPVKTFKVPKGFVPEGAGTPEVQAVETTPTPGGRKVSAPRALAPVAGRELTWTERVKHDGQMVELQRSGLIRKVDDNGDITVDIRPTRGAKAGETRVLSPSEVDSLGAKVAPKRRGSALTSVERGTAPSTPGAVKATKPGHAPEAAKSVSEPTITPAHEAVPRGGAHAWHVSEKLPDGSERHGVVQIVRGGRVTKKNPNPEKVATVVWDRPYPGHEDTHPMVENISERDARGWGLRRGGGLSREGGVVWESGAEHKSRNDTAERAQVAEQRRIIRRRIDRLESVTRGEEQTVTNGRAAARRIIVARSQGKEMSPDDRARVRLATRVLRDRRRGEDARTRLEAARAELGKTSGEKTTDEQDAELFDRAVGRVVARGKAPTPRERTEPTPGRLTGRVHSVRNANGEIKRSEPEAVPAERHPETFSDRVTARLLREGKITQEEADNRYKANEIRRLANDGKISRAEEARRLGELGQARTAPTETTRVVRAPRPEGAPEVVPTPKPRAVKAVKAAAPKAAVSETEKTFRRRPSAMLDTIKRAANGEKLSDEERAALKAAAPSAAKLSVATRRKHLTDVMMSEDPAAGIHELVESGIADHIAPELKDLKIEGEGARLHKDVYSHSLQVLRNAIKEEGGKPDLALRLAALFHDIGKPGTRKIEGGKPTFHAHDIEGAKIVEKRLRELGFDDATIERVRHLTDMHMRLYGGDAQWTDSAIRRLRTDAGPDLDNLFKLVRADVTTRNAREAARIRKQTDRIEQRVKAVAEADQAQGITPGARIESIFGEDGTTLKPAMTRWLRRLGGGSGTLQEQRPAIYRQLEDRGLITFEHATPHLTPEGRKLVGAPATGHRAPERMSTSAIAALLRDATPEEKTDVLGNLSHEQMRDVAAAGGVRIPASVKTERALRSHLQKANFTTGGARGVHRTRVVETPAATKVVRAPRQVSEATQRRRDLEARARELGVPTDQAGIDAQVKEAGIRGARTKEQKLQQLIQRAELIRREEGRGVVGQMAGTGGTRRSARVVGREAGAPEIAPWNDWLNGYQERRDAGMSHAEALNDLDKSDLNEGLNRWMRQGNADEVQRRHALRSKVDKALGNEDRGGPARVVRAPRAMRPTPTPAAAPAKKAAPAAAKREPGTYQLDDGSWLVVDRNGKESKFTDHKAAVKYAAKVVPPMEAKPAVKKAAKAAAPAEVAPGTRTVRRRLSEEELNKRATAAAYKYEHQGKSIQDIATEEHRSYASVHQDLTKRAGIQLRARGAAKKTVPAKKAAPPKAVPAKAVRAPRPTKAQLAAEDRAVVGTRAPRATSEDVRKHLEEIAARPGGHDTLQEVRDYLNEQGFKRPDLMTLADALDVPYYKNSSVADLQKRIHDQHVQGRRDFQAIERAMREGTSAMRVPRAGEPTPSRVDERVAASFGRGGPLHLDAREIVAGSGRRRITRRGIRRGAAPEIPNDKVWQDYMTDVQHELDNGATPTQAVDRAMTRHGIALDHWIHRGDERPLAERLKAQKNNPEEERIHMERGARQDQAHYINRAIRQAQRPKVSQEQQAEADAALRGRREATPVGMMAGERRGVKHAKAAAQRQTAPEVPLEPMQRAEGPAPATPTKAVKRTRAAAVPRKQTAPEVALPPAKKATGPVPATRVVRTKASVYGPGGDKHISLADVSQRAGVDLGTLDSEHLAEVQQMLDTGATPSRIAGENGPLRAAARAMRSGERFGTYKPRKREAAALAERYDKLADELGRTKRPTAKAIETKAAPAKKAAKAAAPAAETRTVRRRLTEAERQKRAETAAHKYLHQKKSINAIAKEEGRSYASVHEDLVKRAGIQLRGRGRPAKAVSAKTAPAKAVTTAPSDQVKTPAKRAVKKAAKAAAPEATPRVAEGTVAATGVHPETGVPLRVAVDSEGKYFVQGKFGARWASMVTGRFDTPEEAKATYSNVNWRDAATGRPSTGAELADFARDFGKGIDEVKGHSNPKTYQEWFEKKAQALEKVDPNDPAALRQAASEIRDTARSIDGVSQMRLNNNKPGTFHYRYGLEGEKTADRMRRLADALEQMAGEKKGRGETPVGMMAGTAPRTVRAPRAAKGERTLADLRSEAGTLKIQGRSKMGREELQRAIAEHHAKGAAPEVPTPTPAAAPRPPAKRAAKAAGRRVVRAPLPHEYTPTSEEAQVERKLKSDRPHGGEHNSDVIDHLESVHREEGIPNKDMQEVPDDLVQRLTKSHYDDYVKHEIRYHEGAPDALYHSASMQEADANEPDVHPDQRRLFRTRAIQLREAADEAKRIEEEAQQEHRDWERLTEGQQYRATQVMEAEREAATLRSEVSRLDDYIPSSVDGWLKSKKIKTNSPEADRIRQIFNSAREQRRIAREHLHDAELRARVRRHQWDPKGTRLSSDEEHAMLDQLDAYDEEHAPVDLSRQPSTHGELPKPTAAPAKAVRAPAKAAPAPAPKKPELSPTAAAQVSALKERIRKAHHLRLATASVPDSPQKTKLLQEIDKADKLSMERMKVLDPSFTDAEANGIRDAAEREMSNSDTIHRSALEAINKRLGELHAAPAKVAGVTTPAQRRAEAQRLKNLYHDDPGAFHALPKEEQAKVRHTLETIANSGDKTQRTNIESLHVVQARDTLARLEEGPDKRPWARTHLAPPPEADSFTSRRARVGQYVARGDGSPEPGTYTDLGTNKHGAPTADRFLALPDEERQKVLADLRHIAASEDRYGRQHRAAPGSAPHVVQAKQLLKRFQEAEAGRGGTAPRPERPAPQTELEQQAARLREIVHSTDMSNEDKRNEITRILRRAASGGRGHENLQQLDRMVARDYHESTRGRDGFGYRGKGVQLDKEPIGRQRAKGNIQSMRDALVPAEAKKAAPRKVAVKAAPAAAPAAAERISSHDAAGEVMKALDHLSDQTDTSTITGVRSRAALSTLAKEVRIAARDHNAGELRRLADRLEEERGKIGAPAGTGAETVRGQSILTERRRAMLREQADKLRAIANAMEGQQETRPPLKRAVKKATPAAAPHTPRLTERETGAYTGTQEPKFIGGQNGHHVLPREIKAGQWLASPEGGGRFVQVGEVKRDGRYFVFLDKHGNVIDKKAPSSKVMRAYRFGPGEETQVGMMAATPHTATNASRLKPGDKILVHIGDDGVAYRTDRVTGSRVLTIDRKEPWRIERTPQTSGRGYYRRGRAQTGYRFHGTLDDGTKVTTEDVYGQNTFRNAPEGHVPVPGRKVTKALEGDTDIAATYGPGGPKHIDAKAIAREMGLPDDKLTRDYVDSVQHRLDNGDLPSQASSGRTGAGTQHGSLYSDAANGYWRDGLTQDEATAKWRAMTPEERQVHYDRQNLISRYSRAVSATRRPKKPAIKKGAAARPVKAAPAPVAETKRAVRAPRTGTEAATRPEPASLAEHRARDLTAGERVWTYEKWADGHGHTEMEGTVRKTPTGRTSIEWDNGTRQVLRADRKLSDERIRRLGETEGAPAPKPEKPLTARALKDGDRLEWTPPSGEPTRGTVRKIKRGSRTSTVIDWESGRQEPVKSTGTLDADVHRVTGEAPKPAVKRAVKKAAKAAAPEASKELAIPEKVQQAQDAGDLHLSKDELNAIGWVHAAQGNPDVPGHAAASGGWVSGRRLGNGLGQVRPALLDSLVQKGVLEHHDSPDGDRYYRFVPAYQGKTKTGALEGHVTRPRVVHAPKPAEEAPKAPETIEGEVVAPKKAVKKATKAAKAAAPAAAPTPLEETKAALAEARQTSAAKKAAKKATAAAPAEPIRGQGRAVGVHRPGKKVVHKAPWERGKDETPPPLHEINGEGAAGLMSSTRRVRKATGAPAQTEEAVAKRAVDRIVSAHRDMSPEEFKREIGREHVAGLIDQPWVPDDQKKRLRTVLDQLDRSEHGPSPAEVDTAWESTGATAVSRAERDLHTNPTDAAAAARYWETQPGVSEDTKRRARAIRRRIERSPEGEAIHGNPDSNTQQFIDRATQARKTMSEQDYARDYGSGVKYLLEDKQILPEHRKALEGLLPKEKPQPQEIQVATPAQRARRILAMRDTVPNAEYKAALKDEWDKITRDELIDNNITPDEADQLRAALAPEMRRMGFHVKPQIGTAAEHQLRVERATETNATRAGQPWMPRTVRAPNKQQQLQAKKAAQLDEVAPPIERTPDDVFDDGAALEEAKGQIARGAKPTDVARSLEERSEHYRSVAEQMVAGGDDPQSPAVRRQVQLADTYGDAAKFLTKRGPAKGKIATPDLESGDKILVTKDSEGHWVPAKLKRGATVVRVSDKPEAIGNGKNPRYRITATTPDGHTIEISPAPTRTGKRLSGVTRATAFHTPAEPRVVRVGAAKPKTFTELKAEAKQLGVPQRQLTGLRARNPEDRPQLERLIEARRAAGTDIPSPEQNTGEAVQAATKRVVRSRKATAPKVSTKTAGKKAVKAAPQRSAPKAVRTPLTARQQRDVTDMSPDEQRSYRAYMRSGKRSHDEAVAAALDTVGTRNARQAATDMHALEERRIRQGEPVGMMAGRRAPEAPTETKRAIRRGAAAGTLKLDEDIQRARTMGDRAKLRKMLRDEFGDQNGVDYPTNMGHVQLAERLQNKRDFQRAKAPEPVKATGRRVKTPAPAAERKPAMVVQTPDGGVIPLDITHEEYDKVTPDQLRAVAKHLGIPTTGRESKIKLFEKVLKHIAKTHQDQKALEDLGITTPEKPGRKVRVARPKVLGAKDLNNGDVVAIDTPEGTKYGRIQVTQSGARTTRRLHPLTGEQSTPLLATKPLPAGTRKLDDAEIAKTFGPGGEHHTDLRAEAKKAGAKVSEIEKKYPNLIAKLQDDLNHGESRKSIAQRLFQMYTAMPQSDQRRAEMQRLAVHLDKGLTPIQTYGGSRVQVPLSATAKKHGLSEPEWNAVRDMTPAEQRRYWARRNQGIGHTDAMHRAMTTATPEPKPLPVRPPRKVAPRQVAPTPTEMEAQRAVVDLSQHMRSTNQYRTPDQIDAGKSLLQRAVDHAEAHPDEPGSAKLAQDARGEIAKLDELSAKRAARPAKRAVKKAAPAAEPTPATAPEPKKTVKRAVKKTTPAAAPAPVEETKSASAVDENVPLSDLYQRTRNNNMRMHRESLTMQVADQYARAGRNGSANRMTELRRRATSDGPDRISPQQVVDELKAIRAEEHDPKFQQELDHAIRGIDSPMTPMPDLPPDTPPEARKLMEDLHAIPYARKGPRSPMAGGSTGDEPSLVDQLAKIYWDVSRGERPATGERSPAGRIYSLLRNHVHEINEGSFPIWDLAGRAGGPGKPKATPLEGELRTWERAHIPTGQMTAPTRPRVTRQPATAREALGRVRQNPFIVRTHSADIRPTQDGRAITGTLSHPYGVSEMVTGDTGPAGVTVHDLHMDFTEGGGTIRHGTVWRHNGTVYLAEHPPTAAGKRRAEATMLRAEAFQAKLRERQPEVAAIMRSYMLRRGTFYGEPRGQRTYATNGNGNTIIWRDGKWGVEEESHPGFFEDILRHEASHSALQSHPDIVAWDPSGGTPSPTYARAMEIDNPYLVDGFRPRNEHAAIRLAAARAIYGNQLGFNGERSGVPLGVTGYGRGDHMEESAEAFALYQMGVIGWDRHDNPVFFRDMFPGRAAHFDRHYPQLRDRQLQGIRELRNGQPLPHPLAPHAASVGVDLESGAFMNEDLALLWLTRHGGSISPSELNSLPLAVRFLLSPEMLAALEKGKYIYRAANGRWIVGREAYEPGVATLLHLGQLSAT